MTGLVADISGDLKKDIDLSTLETALRDTISFMLKSYHAPIMWPRDHSVIGEIQRSDVRRTLDNLVVEAPIKLPGFNVSLHFNERYAPDDTMTFDFLKIKMRDGHLVPLEKLYEVLGRREITFQPEKGMGNYDPFNYNNLMDCLFSQSGMADLKVKRSDSRMLVWRPDNITRENYVISVDRYHHLVPEHLRYPVPIQVSEGWSAVKLVPKFETDGKQQRVVRLSVSDDQGVEVNNVNAVRFYGANYAAFTSARFGSGEGGMIVHTNPNSKSHLNVDRFVPIEARNPFFYQQDGRMFPVYDELVVPLPRFWRMWDSRYGDYAMEQFKRIIDYLSDALSYISVSAQDELAQSQVRYASFAYGLEDLKRTPLRTMAEGIEHKPESPEEVVRRMADSYESKIRAQEKAEESAVNVDGSESEEPISQPEPVLVQKEEQEVIKEQPTNKDVTQEVTTIPSRTPWYITGAATLMALVTGGYALLSSPETIYIKEPVQIEAPIETPALPFSSTVPNSVVEQQQDDRGKYMVITNDAPLRDTLDSVLRDKDGTYRLFSGRTLEDVDVSELTFRASNGNFMLDRGYTGDDGNYYIGLLQVSDKNPRRTGNPGRTVWKNSTFSNALMLTSWYNSPKSEDEAQFIYGKVAEVLNLTFPQQGYTPENLEIRGENLEIYVKDRIPKMNNVDRRSNRIFIRKDDIVVMPIEYLKARTIQK